MSHLHKTPIVDKNGVVTSRNKKTSTDSSTRSKDLPAPQSANPAVNIDIEELTTLATVDIKGAIYSGNGFSNITVTPDGTFDDKSDGAGWYAQTPNYRIDQSTVERLISQGLLAVETKDSNAFLVYEHSLTLTEKGKKTIEIASTYLEFKDGTPVEDWVHLYAEIQQPISRKY